MNRITTAALAALISTAGPVPAASPADALAGRWTSGRISMIQYQDSITGRSAPTNGNAFAYEFHADGSYIFTGLMQNVLYHCTTTLFAVESGAYSFDGRTLSLRPEKNPYKMTNSCAPSSNREGPGKLTNRTYEARIVTGNGGSRLELRDEKGQEQSFAAERKQTP